MAQLKDVMLFLCENYPSKDDLSKARLTKMIYLADWKSAIKYGKQITTIKWIFNHFGPYVEQIIDTALRDPDFRIVNGYNYYNHPKDIITCHGRHIYLDLTHEEKEILLNVINTTKNLNWTNFIRLVYSTYPISTQNRYEILDLPKLAREWNRIKESM